MILNIFLGIELKIDYCRNRLFPLCDSSQTTVQRDSDPNVPSS